MAAVDYEILAYRRLKAILLAHAPLVTSGDPAFIRPGNWVWYDGMKSDPEMAQSGDPASYPKLALEPAGRNEEHWEARPRYGDHDVNAVPATLNRKVAITFNFTVRITHRDLRLAINTPVEAEVMRALRGSNPTMSIPGSPQTPGYDWVRSWGPLAVTRQMGTVEGESGNPPPSRMMSLFPIPVAALFNSADLLT